METDFEIIRKNSEWFGMNFKKNKKKKRGKRKKKKEKKGNGLAERGGGAKGDRNKFGELTRT